MVTIFSLLFGKQTNFKVLLIKQIDSIKIGTEMVKQKKLVELNNIKKMKDEERMKIS